MTETLAHTVYDTQSEIEGRTLRETARRKERKQSESI